MLKKFPGNARVAFIGDSITAANITLRYVIDAYKSVYRESGIRFFNCGVAGGTAEFAVTSFDKDIARYSPTHAVIAFGVNDSRRDLLYGERSAKRLEGLLCAFDTYKAKMSELIDKLLALGVQITLCTPVPYDEYSQGVENPIPGGYALMLGYAEFVRSLAKEKGVALYDQHKIISRVMASEQVHSTDGIHPTEKGYFILARELLRAQGIDAGEYAPLPDYLSKWHSYVARLRKVQAAECMIVQNFDLSTEKKMEMMRAKVENEDWGQPVFESFIRDYVNDKPLEEELYRMIDELYERDIF